MHPIWGASLAHVIVFSVLAFDFFSFYTSGKYTDRYHGVYIMGSKQ